MFSMRWAESGGHNGTDPGDKVDDNGRQCRTYRYNTHKIRRKSAANRGQTRTYILFPKRQAHLGCNMGNKQIKEEKKIT